MATVTRGRLIDAVRPESGIHEPGRLAARQPRHRGHRREAGETMKVSGFDIFSARDKGASMGRNARTGEPAPISPPPGGDVPCVGGAEEADRGRPGRYR